MEDAKLVWEIMVPTVRNNGKPYRTRHHRAWDERVRAVSGGLTVHAPSKGQWISPEGEVYIERMIPVRIVATRLEMDKIVNITLNHYPDQEAVLTTVISEEYILRFRTDVEQPAKKKRKPKLRGLDHNGEVHNDQMWVPKGGTSDDIVQIRKVTTKQVTFMRTLAPADEEWTTKTQKDFLENYLLVG